MYIFSNHSNPGNNIAWKEETISRTTGLTSLSGYLNNLKVTLLEDGSLRAFGSLPKYLKGSNINTFSWEELRASIDQLVIDTGIDPLETHVYKLDLAATLAMPNQACAYFPVLGHLSRFNRIPYPRGILYKNTLRSLAFYDKSYEAGLEGPRLRIELKLKKKLKNLFKRVVYLSDLKDPFFFNELVTLWHQHYEAVEKISHHTLVEPTGMKDFRRQLEQKGIEHAGGQMPIINQINTWKIDHQTKTRYRRLVKDLCQSGNSPGDLQLIEELNEAVKQSMNDILINTT